MNFGLGAGAPLRAGRTVLVRAPQVAKPLYAEICLAVWRAGGNVIHDYRPDDGGPHDPSAAMLELASEAQLDFLPDHAQTALVEQLDHVIAIRALSEPQSLVTADPARLMRRNRALRPFNQRLYAKEHEGRLSWTLAIYGTAGMATEAGLTLAEYWAQIISGCALDAPDPIARWRAVNDELRRRCGALDQLGIQSLHLEGEDVDLRVRIGPGRRWIGGAGRNMPSYEIYTSPDWRGTEGWIRFNRPLYRFGSRITGITLCFRNGRVILATAASNQALLDELLASPGADRLGEFSLTDGRLSPVAHFMADTLFDENARGNTHVAVGAALQETYPGDATRMTKRDWDRLGFNLPAAVHTDMVSTTERAVTATLADGTRKLIYAGDRFTEW